MTILITLSLMVAHRAVDRWEARPGDLAADMRVRPSVIMVDGMPTSSAE